MLINLQPIEKRISFDDGSVLDIHSIFYTIQGEGPFCGYPSVFVRLAGCNLQCPGCDTNYTVPRLRMPLNEIVKQVKFLYTAHALFIEPLVVITGGEPFRQQILPLCQELNAAGYKVQIETNGTLDPRQAFVDYVIDNEYCGNGVTVVCSPKTGKISRGVQETCRHYKYVAHYNSIDESDGLPILALDHTASPRVARPPNFLDCIKIYLQPMDVQDTEQNLLNQTAVVASCLKHGYILQLQIHKFIGVA